MRSMEKLLYSPDSEPGAPEATTALPLEQAAQPDNAARRLVPIDEIPKDSAVPERAFTLQHAPLGARDIIDVIHENGGVASKRTAGPAAAQRSADLWDDQPDLRGVYRQILGGKLLPDQMAEIAKTEGYGDGSVSSFWNQVDAAINSRRSIRFETIANAREQARATTQGKQFVSEVLEPGKKRESVNTANLQIGDVMSVGKHEFRVVDIDPGTLDLTLEDGKRYGVQRVENGRALYVDKASLVPREQDMWSVGPEETTSPEQQLLQKLSPSPKIQEVPEPPVSVSSSPSPPLDTTTAGQVLTYNLRPGDVVDWNGKKRRIKRIAGAKSELKSFQDAPYSSTRMAGEQESPTSKVSAEHYVEFDTGEHVKVSGEQRVKRYGNTPEIRRATEPGDQGPTNDPRSTELSSRVEETPRLRPGENQGDIFAKQTEDLTLAGETGIDYGARQRATETEAAAQKQARVSQEKQQPSLFQAADAIIRDVVAESRKQGLVAPGSAGVQGAIDHLGKIWRQVRDVPKFGDFKHAILGFGSRMQRSFLEAKEIQRHLKKAVPDRLAREGMFNFIESGGDTATLTAWRDATTDPKLRRGYDAALKLTPEQKTAALDLGDFYKAKLAEAQAAGIVAEGRENYINRIVDKKRSKGFEAVSAPGDVGSSRRLSRTFKHGLHRVYESAFEAEQNGIRYQTKDVAELAPIYLAEMNKTIGTRNLMAELVRGRAADGRALAYPKGIMSEVTDAGGDVQARIIKPNFKQQVRDEITGEDVSSHDYKTVDHPALSTHKWIGDARGKPVLMQGNLALHPDIAGHIQNIVGESSIRRWYNSEGSPLMSIPKGILRNADNAQQIAKQMLFSLSGFHHVNIGFHAVEHRVNPLPAFFKSIARDYTIDPKSPVVKDAMAHGLQLAPDHLSARHFMEGFGGSGAEKIPIYGKIAKEISAHLFERFIPSLKLRLYDSILGRNMKRYVGEMARNEITPDQVKYLSAMQSNAALSHLNYIDLGHNPTMRHIFSLTTLAPDFTESRARFLSQAAKGLTGSKAGMEQLEALVYGAGLIWSMARVLNKVADDDWHFEEPFGVVNGSRVYNIRSIQGDVGHMISDFRKFTYGRISPVVKLFVENFITGTNYRGEKISHGETLLEYISNYVPISLKHAPGLRDLFETTKNNPITPFESFLGAMGVHVSRYSPITKVYQLADSWKTAEGIDKDTGVHPVSKYQRLRYALEDGDFDRARDEFQKLIEAGEKRDKISSGFRQSILHPFTGSQASDTKFKKSLSEKERALYDAAVKRRHEILKRYAHMRENE